jgi:hypothetical protein
MQLAMTFFDNYNRYEIIMIVYFQNIVMARFILVRVNINYGQR